MSQVYFCSLHLADILRLVTRKVTSEVIGQHENGFPRYHHLSERCVHQDRYQAEWGRTTWELLSETHSASTLFVCLSVIALQLINATLLIAITSVRPVCLLSYVSIFSSVLRSDQPPHGQSSQDSTGLHLVNFHHSSSELHRFIVLHTLLFCCALFLLNK